ncbi:MAG TPA: hypothetical protein VF642_10465, partial [Propionibacteriaceae bacterium]
MTTIVPPRSQAPGSPAGGQPAPVKPEPVKKEKLPRELDPRNPNFRLQALLDYGSVQLITADDDSGMLAA